MSQNTVLFSKSSLVFLLKCYLLLIRYFITQQAEAVTRLEQCHFEYFQGGDCFCLGHLLSNGLMANSAYPKNNRDDFLNRFK